MRPQVYAKQALSLLALVVVAASTVESLRADDERPPRFRHPDPDRSGVDGLAARKKAQLERAGIHTKSNDGKSGYLWQSVLPLYFGLGDAPNVDRVEVEWPSGKGQVLTRGLAVNRTLAITEPK